LSEVKIKEEPSENVLAATEITQDQNDQKVLWPASEIEGFEEWNLPMIRDFIGCMDTARKKYATLKEQDPDGPVKLVPLLLDEWRLLHPASEETVRTFLVKIKHLKSQKEIIKKYLGVSGLLPMGANGENNVPETADTNAIGLIQNGEKPDSIAIIKTESEIKQEDGTEAFKWDRDMIPDVIAARRSALKIKDDELAKGRKLSFHSLWATEFKKIHPTSTFTSNNLSVHFWTWRKQQQKLQANAKKYQEAAENSAESLQDSLTPEIASPNSNNTN